MINFLIKFLNISSVIFIFNILIFTFFSKFFLLEYALFLTLVLIFILNFFFIIYSFDIKKNRIYFLIGLMIISLVFRFFEYNLFISLIDFTNDPILTWTFTILTSFIIKIYIYKIFFDFKIFKNDKQKKKIFIFSPDLKKGGAERNTLLLLDIFDTKKFDINLILWNKANDEDINVKKIYIKKKNLKTSFISVLSLIIKNNPDYIFSSLNHLNIFLGIIKIISGTKSKQIVRESNLLSLKLKDEHRNNNFLIKIRKFLTFLVYNSSNYVICPSIEIRDDLMKNFKIKKDTLKIIPNLFKKKKTGKGNIKNIKKNFLLAIGRLELQKDYTFMIKAFYESLKFKNNQLIIIGNGSEKINLNTLIKKLSLQKKIKIIKFQKNINQYLVNSKAVLMTSNYEGMPNVIIEASYFGIKCLLTNFKGSSFFKKYKNINILKKDLTNYAKEITYLDSKRIKTKNFDKDFLENKSQKQFIKCFKS